MIRPIDEALEQELGRPTFGPGDRREIGSSFFRGDECNFNPYHRDESSPTFLEDFILKGWLPVKPFISKHSRITSFGSCFAEHIGKYLTSRSYTLSRPDAPEIYISRI